MVTGRLSIGPLKAPARGGKVIGHPPTTPLAMLACMFVSGGALNSTNSTFCITEHKHNYQAFPVAASQLRNTLPQNITSVTSLAVFRKRLKTYLLNHYFMQSPIVPVLRHFDFLLTYITQLPD